MDGGNGTDTLNIAQAAAFALPASTVKNIEIATITSGADVNANVTTWTGLTSLTVGSAATAKETITAATTTAVSVTNSTAFAVDVIGGGGALKITTGAAAITANNAAANAFTSATITGGTTVDVTDNSGASAAVGTLLTTATLSGNTGLATLTGKGLTTVNLLANAGTGSATIVNATAAHTLNLGVNDVTGGVAITDTTATTVNLTATGAKATTASNINLTTVLATALAVDTSAALTLTTTSLAAADVLKTATVKGAGSFTADVSGISSLTSVDASASTGANTLIVDSTVTAYTGGSGVDKVTVAVTATKAIDGGAGTADVYVLNGAFGAAQVGTKVTGFEVLGLGTAATGAYDATGYAAMTHGVVAGAVTYNNVSAAPTLTITAAPTAATTVSLKTDVGTSDTFNLVITGAAGFAANTVTAANIESVTINSDDSATTPTGIQHTLTLVATSAPVVTISGDAGLAFTDASTDLTKVDASGITKGAFTFTAGALTNNATINGGAGDDTIVATAATKVMTIAGGAGNDSITVANAKANVIDGGDGNDTIVVGTGANTITAGAGNDSVTVGAATGLNTVNVGAGTDTVVLSGVQTAAGYYTSVTGMAAGDILDFDLVANGVTAAAALGAKVSLGGASSFANYLDACAVGNGSVNSILKWFQFTDGNTYVVVDSGALATFTDGTDSVIQLVGLVDLSTSTTTTAHVVTLV